jgi:hypothetical protein
MTIHPSPLNMPGAPRAEYPPTKPISDGRISVTTIHGRTHDYPYADMPRGGGWRAMSEYLSIPTKTGRICWPWAQILCFETFGNSAEYVRQREVWSAWENAKKAQGAPEDDRD